MKSPLTTRRAALAAGLLAATALAAPALAQDAAADQLQADETAAPEPGEIVVTARLRNERLQDVPVAVTALPAATLERYQVTNVTDMASFVPGMVVGRQVTGSSASIFLRGVGSSSLSAGFDQSVSFNIDGLAMSRGRELLFTQYDLQQVEVLKGPQALFFGRNTTGGLINITTKNPTDRFEAGLKAGYGFKGREKYTEGYLSGPLSDSVRARLAFRASDSDGALINTAPVDSIDPASGYARHRVSDRRGGSKVLSGRLTLQYDPGGDFDATIKAGATRYRDKGAGDLYERICGGGRTTPALIGGFADPAADCVANGRSPHSTIPVEVTKSIRWYENGVPYTRLDTQFALANLHYRLDGVDLTSITAFYHFRQQDLNDFNGSTRTISVSQYADFKQFSQEFRLQTASDGPLNATGGFFFAKTDFTFNTDTYTLFAPADAAGRFATFSRDDGFKGTTVSAFAELSYKPVPELELTGGARYSFDQKSSYQQANPANSAFYALFPQLPRLNDKYAQENISPQVTATYKVTPDISVYAAYKQGYKAGGFNISQTLTPGASVPAGRFKSEGAEGFEAGVHASAWNRNLRFNLTAYDYKYSDLQVQFYNPATQGSVVQNAGSLKTRGVEGDFNLSVPNSPLSLHGALAYNEAKYGTFIGQCYGGQTPAAGCNQVPRVTQTANGPVTVFNGQVYTGRIAPKAPKWGAQFGAALDFDLTESLRLTLTGDANYTSSYNYTDTLRPDAVQPGVTRLDASASISGNDDMWKLSLIGRNLTNKYVVTTANDMTSTGGTGTGTAAGVVTDLNGIIDRPREIYVEASFKF